ncbi:TetR/AcrR family transcriptional regulator [Myxococcota bacterium]|nr:TetR/AcrR family transcriptional regulator [Myxococcota bacterium]MCZ7616821.1 TetR/AcrR family transcriptional regulator [Myxococcota bacterium]
MKAALRTLEPSRRARKKERTRREIYDAALSLFERHGFDAVTVEAICDAADVARATFFLHFPTKSALLYEFSDRVADEFRNDGRGPDTSAADELRGLVDQMIGRLVAHADVMRAMVREFFSNPVAIEAAHSRGRAFPALIEAIVRRGQARGEFRRGIDPRLASAVVLSTAGAILSGNVFAEGELPAETIRDQFFEVIFGGLLDTSATARRGDSG